MDPRFSLLGLTIGFLIGLTGMGGGALMTPLMILLMGVKPVVAVGTDLAYGAVTRWVGGAAHLRQGTVHRKSAYLLALGSVPATLAGVGLITEIKRADPTLVNVFLLRAVAWALIIVAVVLAAKPLLFAAADKVGSRDWRDRMMDLGDSAPYILPFIGAAAGFMVGLTSVGAGSLIIIALLFLYPRWEARELVGTDVFHAAVLVSAAGLAQLWAGNVNVPMVASLLVGSIPGVLLGSRLAAYSPEGLLRWSTAVVLLLSGAKLL